MFYYCKFSLFVEIALKVINLIRFLNKKSYLIFFYFKTTHICFMAVREGFELSQEKENWVIKNI